VKVIVDQFC